MTSEVLRKGSGKSPESIETQVEAAWLALLECARRRRYFLTDTGKLRHGEGNSKGDEEVGYYTRAVTLVAFREDVFFVYSRMKGRFHG